MRGRRKHKSTSVLKNLPLERQEELYNYLQVHSAKEAHAWLKESGIDTTPTALGVFYSWYPWQQRLVSLADVSECFEDWFAYRNPTASREQIRDAGLSFFLSEAMRTGDQKAFATFAKLTLDEEAARDKTAQDQTKLALLERRETRQGDKLQLDREKFQFDAARACLKQLAHVRAIATDSRLDQRDKIEAVRLKLFGTLPPAIPGTPVSDPAQGPATPATVSGAPVSDPASKLCDRPLAIDHPLSAVAPLPPPPLAIGNLPSAMSHLPTPIGHLPSATSPGAPVSDPASSQELDTRQESFSCPDASARPFSPREKAGMRGKGALSNPSSCTAPENVLTGHGPATPASPGLPITPGTPVSNIAPKLCNRPLAIGYPPSANSHLPSATSPGAPVSDPAP